MDGSGMERGARIWYELGIDSGLCCWCWHGHAHVFTEGNGSKERYQYHEVDKLLVWLDCC